MKKKSETIIAVITKYTISRFYELFLGAFTAFIRPMLLTPEQYGIWTLLKLIPRYASYIHLGARDSMRFFLPLLSSHNNDEKICTVKNSVFTGSLFLNLLLGFILILASFYKAFSMEVRTGLLTMSVIVVIQFFIQFYITVLKAHEKFVLIASSTYLETTVLFVATIPLIYYLRQYGLYISILMVNIIVFCFLKWKYDYDIKMKFNPPVFKEMIIKGAPIMISDFIIQLITTSDRFIVLFMLGSKFLGFYGIAVMILSFLMQIPGTAREVLEPRLMKSVDFSESVKIIDDYLLQPLVNTAWLMPFIIGPAFLLLPVVIPLLLPGYIAGVVPAQILVIGVFFLAMAYVPRSIIVAHDWQSKVSVMLPFVLIMNIGISVLLIKKGLGLAGAALGSSIAFMFLFLTFFVFLSKKVSVKGENWNRSITGIISSFLCMCAVLLIVSVLVSRITVNVYISAIAGTLFYTGIMFLFHKVACSQLPLLKKIKIGKKELC